MQKLITVTNATGQIGANLTRLLLSQGHKVRALSRSADKAKDLAAAGAEVRVGNPDDVAFLTASFQGVDAVFALLPPDYGAKDYLAAMRRIGESQLKALQQSGVRRVVNLSSTGAHLPSGTGPIEGLHEQEGRLAVLKDVAVTHLRPTYFMENWFFSLAPLKSDGVLVSPLLPDLRFAMIATQDIAASAAALLVDGKTSGHDVKEILGERDVSMAEVAAVLAKTSGRAIQYVQAPYEAAEQAMVQAGLGADAAHRLVTMYRGMNEGTLRPSLPRTAASTTKTSIEAYAKEFVKAL